MKKLVKHPLFFPVAVTLLYFVVNLILILLHEPWRDEANPWQIAKTLTPFNIYDSVWVEGHPALWYILLAPFARLGLPYITINIISLLIMSLAVFLLLRFAPFSKPMKIVIILSSAFLYLNPVISRNYCLVVLGAVLVAVFYKDRLKHPIRYSLAISLLLQSHFLAAGLAAGLTIVFFVDYLKSRKPLKPLIFALAIIAVNLASVIPLVLGALSGQTIIQNTISATAPLDGSDFLLDLNISLFGVTLPIFELSMVLIIVCFVAGYLRQLVYLVAFLAVFLFTLAFVYNTSTIPAQKSAMIITALVIIFWTATYDASRKKNKIAKLFAKLEITKVVQRYVPLNALLFIPVVLTIPQTIALSINDINKDYSYSMEISNYINQNLPEDAVIIVADGTTAGVSVTFAPLLKDNRRIYNLITNEYLGFIRYEEVTDASEEDLYKSVSSFPAAHLYYMTFSSGCTTGPMPAESWEHVAEFDARPAAYEPALDIYAIPDPISSSRVDMQKADAIFAVDSIPKVDISAPGGLDYTYAVWNEGIRVAIEDKIVSSNSQAGLTGKIRTRGNTTYEAGAKYGPYQYKIKLDKAASLLGMKEHKDWILLANFMDRSYLRQFYFSGIGNLLMGEVFTPQMKYLELYINGEYRGLYLLVESIEENENRLDIEVPYDASSTSVPYLVQMENGRMPRLWGDWYDSNTFFMIDDRAIPCITYEELDGADWTDTMISLEYPKSLVDMTESQADYIKEDVSGLYKNMREAVPFYDLGIDWASFVNFYLFQEVFYNTGFGSSSIYMYKPLDGKITAGPLWDFDQLLMNNLDAYFTRPPTCDNNLYRYLLGYEEFRSLFKNRLIWFQKNIAPMAEQKLLELQNNSLLREAVQKNEAKYRTWGRRFDDLSVYQNPAIVALRSWDEHIAYIRDDLFTGRVVEGDKQGRRIEYLIEHFDEIR